MLEELQQKVVTFFSGTKYFKAVILSRTTYLKRSSQYAAVWILDVNPKAEVVECAYYFKSLFLLNSITQDLLWHF